MDGLESLELCNCGRPWCTFFAPGVGDYGESYSREDVEELIEDIPKVLKHLKSELKKLDKINQTKENN